MRRDRRAQAAVEIATWRAPRCAPFGNVRRPPTHQRSVDCTRGFLSHDCSLAARPTMSATTVNKAEEACHAYRGLVDLSECDGGIGSVSGLDASTIPRPGQ